MNQNVYILMEENEVTCHSNLTKLIRNSRYLSYYKVYRAVIQNLHNVEHRCLLPDSQHL